jgi:F-type H+-transporting ATPase subunit alpha
MRAFESELYTFLESRYPNVLRDIAEKKQLDDPTKGALTGAVKEFAGDFAARKSAAA